MGREPEAAEEDEEATSATAAATVVGAETAEVAALEVESNE